MKLFISWSGPRSLAVAEVLREELPCLINELEVFLSSEDVDKGSVWFQSITTEINNSNFGIVCLTAENLHKPWILFEAGALAGKFSQKKVAPLLIDLEPAQVAPPLSHLQLTKFTELDFFRLLLSINKNATKPLADAVLERSFKRSWREIDAKVKEKLSKLPKLASTPVVDRTQNEKIDELLSITRSIAANTPSPEPNPFLQALNGGVGPLIGNPTSEPILLGSLLEYYAKQGEKVAGKPDPLVKTGNFLGHGGLPINQSGATATPT